MSGSTERMRRHRQRKRDAAVAAAKVLMPEATEQLPLPVVASMEPLEAGSQGGRPAGPGKDTKAWVNHFLARYRSPLIGLAELYSRPVAELATLLSCTRLEAMQLQRQAMTDVLPYVHQKLPAAVQIEGAATQPVMIAIAPTLAQAFAAEDERNQQVIEGDPT